MQRIGIDFGATGIKGAVVDISVGELATGRYRIPTPDPSTPSAVTDVIVELVAQITDEHPCSGWAGCAIPAAVAGGIVLTAANIDETWIGTDGDRMLTAALQREMTLLNDADAAGLAEMSFGAGRGRAGTVVVLTLGTGIGSAVFTDGHLLRNTELGHLEMWGGSAEDLASAKARERQELDWQAWVEARINPYLAYLESLIWPDLFIISGGISKKPERFFPYLESRAEILPARLRNNAGIVGAALAAHIEETS